jgi:hypothetical protein
LNVAAAASTTLALGSIAWYYHLYGPVAHAMTPAEEGYVLLPDDGRRAGTCRPVPSHGMRHKCCNASMIRTIDGRDNC